MVECYTIIEFFVFLLASGEGRDTIFGERQIEIYGVAEEGWRPFRVKWAVGEMQILGLVKK